jgi:hypothetical protein
MTVNRDQLFTELDSLMKEEIEAGLAADVWDEPKRQLVEHYLDQMKLTTMQLEAASSAKEAAQAAEAQARRGNLNGNRLADHCGRGNGCSYGSSIRCFPCSEELDVVRGLPVWMLNSLRGRTREE